MGPTLVFIALLLAAGALWFWSGDVRAATLRRLRALPAAPAQRSTRARRVSSGERLRTLLIRIGRLGLREASLPQLRERLYHAQIRTDAGVAMWVASKTLLSVSLCGALLLWQWLGASGLPGVAVWVLLPILALVGQWLPELVVKRRTAWRKRHLMTHFPDAFDLLRVVIDAGVGFDEALERVARELEIDSPTTAYELHLLSVELRSGVSRADAFRRIAERVGVDEIAALAAVLIQADRFGTSISVALRAFSKGMRERMRMRAEESAAKLSTKLLLPMIMLLFPALLLVLLGPAALSIYHFFVHGGGAS